uniref:Uncharacterized protein n=1 Tax=Peronospora matthiolae TaxID=2874970 RepID=A0AAV1UU24_9STRA
MEIQQSESNRCQVRGQYGRDGCVSNAEVSSMPASSTHASSLQISSMRTTGLPASGKPKSSVQVSGIHAPQLHSTQHFFISTSDASSMRPGNVSVTADGDQGTGHRAAARAAPSRIHQRSMKSPTAATVLNCSESEKSLVQLLSSLNQGRAPVNSVAADVQSVDSSYRQNVSGSNGKVAESGCSGGPGNTKTEASFQVDSGRGILDNDYQPERPSRDQAFVCSTAAVDSSPRDRSNVDDRSIEVSKLRKRKSGENDAENGLTARGLPNMASRDAFRAVYRDDSAASQQHVAGQRQQQTGTRPSLKPGDCDKDTASKIELKKNHSSQRLPPAHRRPGRPRKAPSDETAATVLTPQTERKGHQDRRSTTPSKRGRGRPPKRGKRAKGNGEETTGDNYNEEQEGGMAKMRMARKAN